ncbi:GNAT family N-acetyltransferase [Cribrihabitans sp. XS_ASV171]
MTDPDKMIRPFDAADTGALSAIWLDASRVAHAFIGEQRLLCQRQLIEEKYLPMAETWVACQGETPVGFISLLDSFVGGLFVAPDGQGRGIGRALVTLAAQRKGALSVEVYSENRSAVLFYQALGFQEVSRRPTDDEGLPFELILMHREA